jgi:hypothetical protein
MGTGHAWPARCRASTAHRASRAVQHRSRERERQEEGDVAAGARSWRPDGPDPSPGRPERVPAGAWSGASAQAGAGGGRGVPWRRSTLREVRGECGTTTASGGRGVAIATARTEGRECGGLGGGGGFGVVSFRVRGYGPLTGHGRTGEVGTLSGRRLKAGPCRARPRPGWRPRHGLLHGQIYRQPCSNATLHQSGR